VYSTSVPKYVGLYREIYGVQPKPNRLYLEPHLTGELTGTKLRYQLRGRLYAIDLNTKGCAVTAGACTLRDSHSFGVNATDTGLEYFPGTNTDLGHNSKAVHRAYAKRAVMKILSLEDYKKKLVAA
jgi:hypothetical protein